MKRINPDKIIVLDDIPQWMIAFGQDQFKYFRFSTHHYGDPARPEDGWLFGCMLFDKNGMNWFHDAPNFAFALNEYITKHAVFTADNTAVIRDLIRVRVNGMNPACIAGVHTDSSKPDHWAVLYYVTDSTGSTDIYDLDNSLVKSIEPKAGRMIMFPACYPHKANPPSENHQWRVTLNYNYVIEGNLNKNIFVYS